MAVRQPVAHRNKKISMLELMRLCQRYGVDTDGIKKIAEETGKSKRTIIKLIDEYCIIPNLQAGLLDE